MRQREATNFDAVTQIGVGPADLVGDEFVHLRISGQIGVGGVTDVLVFGPRAYRGNVERDQCRDVAIRAGLSGGRAEYDGFFDIWREFKLVFEEGTGELGTVGRARSEEHTSELQSRFDL